MHILADFITKLPLAQGYDSILVVVDWLTKMVHFIPTTEKTLAEGLARLFRDNMWKLHGLPESIISDRGLQFAAGIMKELNEMLGIKSKLSTAFHPQTDRQTERVNQELEQYLRMFIDHRQEQQSLHIIIKCTQVLEHCLSRQITGKIPGWGSREERRGNMQGQRNSSRR